MTDTVEVNESTAKEALTAVERRLNDIREQLDEVDEEDKQTRLYKQCKQMEQTYSSTAEELREVLE